MQIRQNYIERQLKLLEAAAQVSHAITSPLDLETLFRQVVDIICDTYGFYYAGVFLIDPHAPESALLRTGRGELGSKLVKQNHKLKIDDTSMIGWCINHKRARVTPDVYRDLVHRKVLPETRSEMALPLMFGDDVIGALTIQSAQNDAFTDMDVTSLQAMADQLAVAIQNARLLSELEEVHHELVRAKTFEAIAAATGQAIHWIGIEAMPIVTTVERLRKDVPDLALSASDAESLYDDLALIEENARRVVAVREGLIGPARKHQPRPALIRDVIKDTAVRLGIPPHIIAYHMEPVPLVRVDTTQISRMATNLIINAMEAMEGLDQPRLTIGVRRSIEPDMVEVTIADTGRGIPAENLDKIWEAFFTTKNATEHLGLGLPACQQIVQQMEGRISVRSEIGQGTTVTILLPVVTCESKATLPAGNTTLLIVDDDDEWRHLAQATLGGAGYHVQAAPTLASVAPATCDRIIVEQALEQASAIAVLHELGADVRRAIVVTSCLVVEQTQDLLQAGAREVVLKPYTVEELAALL